MRLVYLFALAVGLSLPNESHAQAVPSGTKPASPPTQPPGPATPVQPGRATPAQTNYFPTSLYQMNDVGKSLNLTQSQIGQLNQLTTKTQGAYRNNYNNLSNLQEADRWAKNQELNRQYNTDWNQGARNIFDENQWSRYQQLNYQHGGFNSLYESNVQKELNLTPAQIKSLDEQRTWSTQQLQGIDRTAATDPTKATQMYRDYWKQRQQRFDTFLTPAQQKSWQQMTGEPYTFQPNFSQQPNLQQPSKQP